MKRNLITLLTLIALPFIFSKDIKAQSREYFLRDTIPVEEVPERFRDYQNRENLDTLQIDTSQNIYTGVISQCIYLDINKNGLTDVKEFKGIGVKNDSVIIDKKTSFPWKYYFFEEEDVDGKASYRVWYDFFIDGIDGDESSQNILFEHDLNTIKEESSDPFNSKYWPEVYNPGREVKI